MTHVVLLGDFNERLSSLDRYAAAGAAQRADPARSRTLSCLQQAGYTDVYRHMHPLTPGYTHEIDSVLRTTRSRIDYIWTHSLDAHAHSRVRIDTRLHHLSHHHVLWAQLHVRDAVQPLTPRMRLRIPNMRAATASHELAFVRSLERRLLAQQYAFPSHARDDDPAIINELADALTRLTHAAEVSQLPITGAKPLRSGFMLRLEK